MPIIPTGDPAWLRTADHTVYGGHESKSNFLDRSSLDPLTDVDATQFARLTADMPAAVRTAPFAEMSLNCVDTPSPGAPVLGGYIDSGSVVSFGGVALMTGVRPTPYFGDDAPTGYAPRAAS
jgi:hypothetical protein